MDGDRVELEACPIIYRRCYVGDATPKGVTEVSEALLASSPCIALEVQDIQLSIQQAMESAQQPASYRPEDVSELARAEFGNLRYYLNLKDARMLACHLIYALANTDDRIASRLVQVLDELHEEGPLEPIEPED